MSSQPDPFWLCHECGAQMHPMTRDGVSHCASCDGEFIEILDSNINPDPFHELPSAPPTRPRSTPPQRNDSASSAQADEGAHGDFVQSLLSGLFGAAANPGESDRGSQSSSPGQERRGGPRVRTFNIGGGRGQIMFGSFNGPIGGSENDGGLESFFPGFGPPPGLNALRRDNQGGQPGPHFHPLVPGDSMGPEELLRTLMSVIAEDGMMPPGMGGAPGRMNMGDYAMTQDGFDRILEDLMQVAGPQGPIPASDVVIEGLPKFKLAEETLEKSTFKDCPVCKDDFNVGDEVMRVPCAHIFHPDCLQPWLRVNGSCPVCRFSLVPEGGQRPVESQPTGSPQENQPQSPGQSTITSILQRLWGQSGSSNPTSPTTETRPPIDPTTAPTASSPSRPAETSDSQVAGETDQLPAQSAPTSGESNDVPSMSSAIPDDYRERHRQREQQQQQNPPHDDLD